MEKAVIYARFSSDKQSETSIDAQVRACRDYAAQNNMLVGEIYSDEAISGKGSKTASRAGYQKLLRDAKKESFDTILIHKYDRIARNVGEHVNLEMRLNERCAFSCRRSGLRRGQRSQADEDNDVGAQRILHRQSRRRND